MATTTSFDTESVALLVPFQISAYGGVARAVGEDQVIKQHLISTLMTNFGERVRFPGFGANVVGKLFDPKDELESQAASNQVRDALRNISTHLTIDVVKFVDDPRDPAGVILQIRYSIANQSSLLEVKLLNGLVTNMDSVS